jgi:hypothetical protein
MERLGGAKSGWLEAVTEPEDPVLKTVYLIVWWIIATQPTKE